MQMVDLAGLRASPGFGDVEGRGDTRARALLCAELEQEPAVMLASFQLTSAPKRQRGSASRRSRKGTKPSLSAACPADDRVDVGPRQTISVLDGRAQYRFSLRERVSQVPVGLPVRFEGFEPNLCQTGTRARSPRGGCADN
jgi:hypothetical protein